MPLAERAAWIAPLSTASCLLVAVVATRLGGFHGALAGAAAGGLHAALYSRLDPAASPAAPAIVAVLLAATGAAVGGATARERAKNLRAARRIWTSLRLGQIGEFLSYCLYQLREYQISATALVENVALSAPKNDAALTERLEKLRRVIAELNDKAARLLGENSGVTTHAPQVAALSLRAAVTQAAAEAATAFSASGVTVDIVEEGAPGTISCDQRALRLCLLAVLQNSFEACAARGRGAIQVTVRQSERRAEIEVVDDGGGISADAATLFEPFYAARSGTEGMGLGLPMARRLIERLGGAIRAASRDGGAAVLLELPTTRELPVVRNEESTWAGRRRKA